MKRSITRLFKICLVSFLLGGTTLVLGQVLGVVLEDGELIVQVWNVVAKPTFVMSAVASLLGFVLASWPQQSGELQEQSND